MNSEVQRQQAIQARCVHPSGQWREFTVAALEQTVITRFEQMVARYPDRLAISMDDHQLSYRALNAAANRLAHAILAQHGDKTGPLALVFEQSIDAIVAMLAVWKAGKFFLVLSLTDPVARRAQLLQDSGAMGIITTRCHQDAVLYDGQPALPTINVDELSAVLPTANLNLVGEATDVACITYTSGSTGRPKGVTYTQRNVLYRVQQYTNLIHLCAEDRLALVEYYSFNGSLRDIFSALLNGAALFLFNLKAHGAQSFAQLLHQAQITLWVPVVTAFRAVSATLQPADLPHLRVLGMTGETLHRQDLAFYQQCTPATCLLSIGLGSSETVGAILCGWFDHRSELPEEAVPIGYPVTEVDVQLLDETGKPVSVGESGEIVVRSAYLAQGYWQQPTLTANVFQPDPRGGAQRIYATGDLALQQPNDQFVHLGRKDQQIKIRGHRVELTEVEQALVALQRFSAVAVVARLSHTGEQRLIAYLVPTNDARPTSTELRQQLLQTLPAHMIPAHFIFLDALPLTVTGKVDRTALPDLDTTRPNVASIYQAPRTPIEAQLAGLWSQMLSLTSVGIDDNFLELGGNSLTAMQIISRISVNFQVSIPIQQLFAAPTIADMAQVIAQHQAAPTRMSEALLTALENLSDAEAGQLFTAEHRR
ncbi:hypothetical protein BH10CHL1_BH10CHL1_40500 [soil metagenome]